MAPAGASFAHRVFHHRKVRFDVSVGGLYTLMSEPQCDHGRVHPRLEQVHRGGVTNQMRRDMFALEARTRRNGPVGGPAQQVGNAVAGKTSCTRAREREAIKSVAELLKPRSQDLRCLRPQRDGTFLSSLPVQFQGGWRIKDNFIAADPSDLGDACAAVVQREKEGMVAAAIPIGAIGGR